jgi:hypothetical protein
LIASANTISHQEANGATAVLSRYTRLYSTSPHHSHATPIRALGLTLNQDSDTNPNTTASSVAGDAPLDGRKKRAEAMNMRKSIYGKKHDRLGASKVRTYAGALRAKSQH